MNFIKNAVKNEGLGGTFKYLIGMVLLLSLIFVIGLTFEIGVGMNDAYNEFYEEVDPNFYVEMKSYNLSSNIKQPFVSYHKNFALIIDTTGIPHKLPEFQEGILIKKWNAVFKHEGDVYDFNYKETDIDDFRLNKEQSFELLALIKRVAMIILPILIFIGTIFVGFIGKLIYISIFAFIVWIIAAIMKVKDVAYQKSFTLTLYAATAPFIVRGILEILGLEFPGMKLIFYIAYFTYIVLVLRAMRVEGKA